MLFRSVSALVAFGVDRNEDKWESETSASLVSSSDDETRPRYPYIIHQNPSLRCTLNLRCSLPPKRT